MIKLIGKVESSLIPRLDTVIFNDGDRDVQNDDVAVDACISRFSKFFEKQAREEGDISPNLISLIRSVRRQIVGGTYEDLYTCSEERDTGSILVFRNVSQHNDLGFYLYKRNSMMKPRDRIRAATFSIALKGCCVLNLHRKNHVESLELSPGDVYLFDQNVVHSVTGASEACVHITISVPMILARKLMPLPGSKVTREMRKEESEELEFSDI